MSAILAAALLSGNAYAAGVPVYEGTCSGIHDSQTNQTVYLTFIHNLEYGVVDSSDLIVSGLATDKQILDTCTSQLTALMQAHGNEITAGRFSVFKALGEGQVAKLLRKITLEL